VRNEGYLSFPAEPDVDESGDEGAVAREQWLCALACAALLVPWRAACASRNRALRIGHVWIGCEPLYLARDLGYLDPKVIQLVE